MTERKKIPTPKTARRITDDRDRALYVISIAAELAGVHPQTLRMYERKGLLKPARTEGRARRYSDRDIERVRLIQSLTQDGGMNLAGVHVVMELTRTVDQMNEQIERLQEEARRLRKVMDESSQPTALVPLAQARPAFNED